MARSDWAAVLDVLGIPLGREPQGFLTHDERTMIRFQNQLDSVLGVPDLEDGVWATASR